MQRAPKDKARCLEEISKDLRKNLLTLKLENHGGEMNQPTLRNSYCPMPHGIHS
ncbi:CagY family CD-EC repeat-containing protein [Segatella albensis]|uniref:CagY family CD-EC repeat-containing protein n=1 Tax=Segatella albensis TaxID=77768 RepID=UPI0012B653B6